MADAFVSSATGPTDLVTMGYDQAIGMANRHRAILRELPDKHLVDPTHAGSSYRLFKYVDLAEATAELTSSETVDPDAVTIPQVTHIDVAYRDFGRVVIETKRLEKTALSKVNPAIVNLLARDLRLTLDNEVGVILYGGTNVKRAANRGSTVTVAAGDLITAQKHREIVTTLRTNAAEERLQDLFWCGMHPNVALDLRTETGAGAWRDDHKYASPELFWPGTTGVYEGAFIQESARMKVATDGASSAKVYRTMYAGKEALAEVVWEEPTTVVGQIVDKLARFQPFGWKGALNWARYREENLFRFESSATL